MNVSIEPMKRALNAGVGGKCWGGIARLLGLGVPGLAMLFACCVQIVYAQPGPEDEDRRYKLAQSYEQTGDIPGALRIYRELHEADSESRAYFDGLTRTMLALGRFKEFEPYMAARIQRYPNDPGLRIVHGDILFSAGSSEAAIQELEEALKIAPKDLTAYQAVGETYVKHREFERAAAVYEAAKRKFGRSVVLADRLARIYAILGEYRKMSNEYIDLLAEDPTRLNYAKAGLSLITNVPAGVEAAIELTEEISGIWKDRPVYLELLSWLYAEKGEYDKAFDVAVRMDKMRDSRGSDIYAFADQTLRAGEYAAAIRAYEYFLENFERNNPLTAPVMYNYVLALQSKYDTQGAISEEQAVELIRRYREVLEFGRGGSMGAQASMKIATLQANVLNDPKAALETLSGGVRESRTSLATESMLLSGELLMRMGRIDDAQKQYLEILTIPLTSRDVRRHGELARLRFAETLLYQNKFKEAVDSLTVLTKDVESVAANDALAWLFLLQEHMESAPEALRSYISGRYAEVRRDWPGVVVAADEAVSLSPKGTIADDALLLKAQALRRMDRPREAVDVLLRIVEDYSDGTYADEALFTAAQILEMELTEPDRAMELYTKVLVDFPYSQYVSRARERIRSMRQES